MSEPHVPHAFEDDRSNPVLAQVARALGNTRPPVPASLPFTLSEEPELFGTFARLWFRTRGCRHTYRGGCTMCDYWISGDVSSDTMVASVRAGLAQLHSVPSILLLETSGSFLDTWEVPEDARRRILAAVREVGPGTITFETRADTISAETVEECVELSRPARVCVEIGVESTDDWVLRYCVNKLMNVGEVRGATACAARAGATTVANVIVGTPFLSPREQVVDAARSIRDVFAIGFDHCVVFPVNTKMFTLAYWLEDRDLYARPPLWAIVDVLAGLDPSYLPSIDLAWHRPRPDYHPAYASTYRGPTTCPACFDRVAGLLDKWRSSSNRVDIMDQLNQTRCTCRDKWQRSCDRREGKLLLRLTQLYERIAREVLGDDAWVSECAKFTRRIPEHRIVGVEG